MSRETAVEIHITLDALKAPPNASIAERIRGLVGPAAAALHEAGFVVGEGTLAEAIGMLAKDRDGAAETDGQLLEALAEERKCCAEAIAQCDDQANMRLAAVRAQVAAEEAARLATEHAGRMDTQWAAAERRAAALEEEAQRLRADVERLSNQLDYATELCLAGFRQ